MDMVSIQMSLATFIAGLFKTISDMGMACLSLQIKEAAT